MSIPSQLVIPLKKVDILRGYHPLQLTYAFHSIVFSFFNIVSNILS